jgi:hypothetical protein
LDTLNGADASKKLRKEEKEEEASCKPLESQLVSAVLPVVAVCDPSEVVGLCFFVLCMSYVGAMSREGALWIGGVRGQQFKQCSGGVLFAQYVL